MHIKSKKRLGQNFLVDRNLQRKIVNACAFQACDVVCEVGAGRGELTGLIARNARFVYAIEIDPYLCSLLAENLKGYTNTAVINQDILKLNLRKYFRGERLKGKIIGNIPYYITSPIIEHLLGFRDIIETVFITVQKEFAERIIAVPGSKEYGSLSCFVQYYAQPEILFPIKRNCFFPVPGVDSSLLRMAMREGSLIKRSREKLLFKVIRSSFNKRRKTMRNSLKEVISQSRLDTFFNTYGIDCNTRPERLSLTDFINLANTLKKQIKK